MKLTGKVVQKNNVFIIEIPVWDTGIVFSSFERRSKSHDFKAEVALAPDPENFTPWGKLAAHYHAEGFRGSKLYAKLKGIEGGLRYAYWNALVEAFGQDIVNLAKSANATSIGEVAHLANNEEIQQLFKDGYWALGRIALDMKSGPLVDIPISTLDFLKGNYYAKRNWKTDHGFLCGSECLYLNGKATALTADEAKILAHLNGSVPGKRIRNAYYLQQTMGEFPKELKKRYAMPYTLFDLEKEWQKRIRCFRKSKVSWGSTQKVLDMNIVDVFADDDGATYPRTWRELAGRDIKVSVKSLYRMKSTSDLYQMLNTCGNMVPLRKWNQAMAAMAKEGLHVPLSEIEANVFRFLFGVEFTNRYHYASGDLRRLLANAYRTGADTPMAQYCHKWFSEPGRLVVLYPVRDELHLYDGSWDYTPEQLVRNIVRNRERIALARARAEALRREKLLENYKYDEHEMTIEDVHFTLLHPQDYDKEGKEMHHCVGSYTIDGYKGNYKVYHAEYEEKPYTLGIEAFSGMYRFQQCYGTCNSYAPAEVREASMVLIDLLNKELGDKRMDEHFAEPAALPAGNPMPDGFDAFGDW